MPQTGLLRHARSAEPMYCPRSKEYQNASWSFSRNAAPFSAPTHALQSGCAAARFMSGL